MPPLTHLELALAENLILSGATTGPRLIYPLLARQQSNQHLGEILEALQLVRPDQLQAAQEVAQGALELMQPPGFTFSEGATVGSWELLVRRGVDLGGEVWLGRHPSGRTASLRLIPPGSGHDPERSARFLERSNAGLDPPHPSILKVDEAEEDFGWLYTATIGLDCVPLAGLRDNGPLPEPTALAFAQSLAGSLHVVHGLGVVHGGLSPLGVVVRESRTYLTDFGASSALLDGPAWGCLPGGRLGLLLYAAPQLIAGDSARGLDARDDLFALGALLYYAVCPVTGNDQRASPDAPWSIEPPISPGLRAILTRLLSPSEEERYPDTVALQGDLSRVASGGSPGAPAPVTTVCRGRRHPSAGPQQVLTPELAASAQAPDASHAPEPLPSEPQPATVTDVDRVPQFDDLEDSTPTEADPRDRPDEAGADAPARRASSRRKAALKAPAPAKRASSQRFAATSSGTGASKGGGWLLFAFSLVVVIGGGVLGYLIGQPRGPELVRAQLVQADRLARAESAPYGEALALVTEALDKIGAKDPAALRDAVALYDEVIALARAERDTLVPSGIEAKREEIDKVQTQLLDLIERAKGCPVLPLAEYDLARRDDKTDNARWGNLGEALLLAGHPAEAADAFKRCGRKPDQAISEWARDHAVFLRPGPYLLAPPRPLDPEEAKGEAKPLELIVRTKPTYLGKTEVTRADYARYLETLKGVPPAKTMLDGREPEEKTSHAPKGWDPDKNGASTLPATGVDFFDAVAFARSRGLEVADAQVLRLAARGPLALDYPWGSAKPDLAYTNAGELLRGPAPAGALAGGRSVCGAFDLVGNVEEWVFTKLGSETATFGGHYQTPLADLRAGLSKPIELTERRDTLGFRVVKELEPAS